MVNDADARVSLRQVVRDASGPVGAPVVNDGDLEVVREARQHSECVAHQGLHVVFLVERRKEEREAG